MGNTNKNKSIKKKNHSTQKKKKNALLLNIYDARMRTNHIINRVFVNRKQYVVET